MPVLGIGGLFFRSNDPDPISAWYRDHLGVGSGCVSGDAGPPDESMWTVAGGPVVFAPFPADTDYWAGDTQYMLNLRVSDLDGLLAALRAADIACITKREWDDPRVGRFARIHDPEGRPIELWELPG